MTNIIVIPKCDCISQCRATPRCNYTMILYVTTDEQNCSHGAVDLISHLSFATAKYTLKPNQTFGKVKGSKNGKKAILVPIITQWLDISMQVEGRPI